MQLNNKFLRAHAVVTDKYGIDPLLDKVVPKLQEITTYTIHEVSQEERGAPDLISFREYGTEDYWWHIMSYNGLCSYKDVVQGISLKIPDIGSLISITNRVLVENKAKTSTDKIAVI